MNKVEWGVIIISDKRQDRMNILKPVLNEIEKRGVPLVWQPAVFFKGDFGSVDENHLLEKMSWIQRKMTPLNVVGVCMAHVSAMTLATKKKWDYALILEDDVESLEAGWVDQINLCVSKWPGEMQMTFMCPNILADIDVDCLNDLGHDRTFKISDFINPDNRYNSIKLNMCKPKNHLGLQAALYRTKDIPHISTSLGAPDNHIDWIMRKAIKRGDIIAGTWYPFLFVETSQENQSHNQSNLRYSVKRKSISHLCQTAVFRLGKVNFYAPMMLGIISLVVAGLAGLSNRPWVYWQSPILLVVTTCMWIHLRPNNCDAVLDLGSGLFIFIVLTLLATLSAFRERGLKVVK